MTLEVTEDVADIFETKETIPDELLEIANTLVEVRKERDFAELRAKEAKVKEEELIQSLSLQMITKGIKSIDRKDGIKLISVITPAFYAKKDMKEALLQAFKDNGDGGMIKEDVNYQTMQTFFKTLDDEKYKVYSPLVEKIEKKGIQIRGLNKK